VPYLKLWRLCSWERSTAGQI